MEKPAAIALEDGFYLKGISFGAEGEKTGEIVFNTSMTGYQEILTDPSYKGQIVAMTYTQIGNYGINSEDIESYKPQVEGFIVKEVSKIASNWRAKERLDEYLKRHNIIGVEQVDTRALTKHIRVKGAMKGIISTCEIDKDLLVEKAKASLGIIGRDLVKEVTCDKSYEFKYLFQKSSFDTLAPYSIIVDGVNNQNSKAVGPIENNFQNKSELKAKCYFNLKENFYTFKVAAFDFGIKLNILRLLSLAGCNVTVFPATTSAEDILSIKPDGIFLSNGPGDPEGLPHIIAEIKKLLGKKPIFGICLGHQLLGLAFGGKTYKLKFGHRGGNQPVKNLKTGKIEITAQNHGFAVDIDSIPDKKVILTHINLNDNTVEGMEHTSLPIFSVQYHPEASPGPHDSRYLFEKFVKMMADNL